MVPVHVQCGFFLCPSVLANSAGGMQRLQGSGGKLQDKSETPWNVGLAREFAFNVLDASWLTAFTATGSAQSMN